MLNSLASGEFVNFNIRAPLVPNQYHKEQIDHAELNGVR